MHQWFAGLTHRVRNLSLTPTTYVLDRDIRTKKKLVEAAWAAKEEKQPEAPPEEVLAGLTE